mmetsp:Transcript_9825/g.18451  ORF Transcript_9825/g.18451 Transcript_9825/m.18451 type:complete len:100 (+) Transcript_9825:3643-3942(+)
MKQLYLRIQNTTRLRRKADFQIGCFMCLRIKLVFYIQSFHLCRESVMKAGHSETRDLTILRDLGVRKVVIHTVKSSKYFYLFTSPECVGTEIYKSQIHT